MGLGKGGSGSSSYGVGEVGQRLGRSCVSRLQALTDLAWVTAAYHVRGRAGDTAARPDGENGNWCSGETAERGRRLRGGSGFGGGRVLSSLPSWQAFMAILGRLRQRAVCLISLPAPRAALIGGVAEEAAIHVAFPRGEGVLRSDLTTHSRPQHLHQLPIHLFIASRDVLARGRVQRALGRQLCAQPRIPAPTMPCLDRTPSPAVTCRAIISRKVCGPAFNAGSSQHHP